jgi:hypothetical protein
MSYNGSGTFVINSAGQPVVTGTVISSTAFNALTADLATGLSTALTKDGQTTPTANLPMGTFKFTGLGNGSAATDSANISQVQNSFGSFLTVTGTDTITATVSPSLTAYASGQMFAFVAGNTNTGAVTINISSLGAKAITKTGNTALVASDLIANYLYIIVYDGTQFQVVGVSSTTFANLTISGVLTLSGAGVQLTSSGTGAWKMPVGTTAQRPTGASGLIRLNSTSGSPEWYDATTSQWLLFSQPAGYTVNYLVVAGGGGGGQGNNTVDSGGGGGAGGLITNSTSLSSGTAYTITVGAGGANNTSGSNSVFGAIATSIGGGRGASNFATSVAGSGGSGGGSGGSTGYLTGGAATGGQGNVGGTGSLQGTGSGGGGAGAAGSPNAVPNVAGAGGVGLSNSLSGSAVFYAGGGGGSGVTGAAGGTGGGGAGGSSVAGTAGSANTGGGGGGGSGNTGSYAGGAGGSGIVIISYAGSQRGTGGTVTSSGGNTIHTFTSSGTYNA